MRLQSLWLPLVATIWAASCALDSSGTAENRASTSVSTGGGTTSSVNAGGGGTTSTAQGGAGGVGGAGGTGGIGGAGGAGGTGGGECIPTAEDCATRADESCEGGGTCAGMQAWKLTFGSSSSDEAQSVAVDSEGNVLVAGRFQATINAGGIDLQNQGGDDLFLVKLDPQGVPLWSNAYGDAATQNILRVAVDSAGNALLTGYFEATVTFPGLPVLTSAGNGDILVAKVDPAGMALWARSFGSTGRDRSQGIAVDSGGNVLLTGSIAGPTAFDAVLVPHAGGEDVFIAKLDPNGEVLWAKGAGDDNNQRANAIAVNDAGDVAVTGSFQGSLDFGAPLSEQSGNDAMFVVKLDATGAHQWSKTFGGPGLDDQNGHGLAFDNQGNLVVASDFQGTTTINGVNIASSGANDALLITFTPDGAILWNRQLGTPQIDAALGVAVDVHGQLAVTGAMGGALDFGDGALPFGGALDVFVAKLGPNPAVHHWSRSYGDVDDQVGMSVALDELGSVVIVGVFDGTIDGATTNGAGDAFVMKFTP